MATARSTSRSSLCASLGLLLALAIVGCYGESNWDGQWTDNWGYGKTQYICVNEETRVITGVWSRAGVIYGQVSADRKSATGKWYEAGTGRCYKGSFTWTLSSDFNTITGSFECDDGSDKTDVRETRIDSQFPSAEQCARLHTSPAAGHWLAENNELDRWDVCTNKFVSSYEFPTNDYAGDAQGYTSGEDYENSRIISGRWIEGNGMVGVSIGYRTEANVLVNLVWHTSAYNAHLNPQTQPTVFRFIPNGTPDFCNRNKYLLRPYAPGAASSVLPQSPALLVAVCIAIAAVVAAIV